jgi:hypothetical protein
LAQDRLDLALVQDRLDLALVQDLGDNFYDKGFLALVFLFLTL